MSRMTYLRSPLSNIRPRRGPCPPKKPFIAFGPNMSPVSFAERCLLLPVGQLAPVVLPERVPDPAFACPHLQMAALCELGEHPIRLGHRERGLQRRQRRRELAPPRERPEKLPLLALLGRRPVRPLPRTGLGNPRQPPPGRRQSRHQQEGDGQDQEEREEVEGGPNDEEQEQPSHHKPHRKPRTKTPP